MKKILLLLLLIAYMPVTYADSTTVRYGRQVTIREPVHGDLYVAGGTVSINAPVYGELVVAAGNVFINDTVTNDIIILSGNAVIKSYAGDDIRCVAGSVHILGKVAGDLVAGGGEIIIWEDAQTSGLLGAGGNVTINGNVNGDIRGVFGKFVLNAPVLGMLDGRSEHMTINARVEGDAVLSAPVINIGPHAFFTGNLRYWNKNEGLLMQPHQLHGKAVLDHSLAGRQQQWYYLGSTTVLGLIWYLGMALSLLLVLQLLAGRLLRAGAPAAKERPLRSIGYGLAVILGIPVAAVLVICSVIGIPVGLITLILYTLLLVSAPLLSALLFANIYAQTYQKQWGYWKICVAAFLLFILLKLAFALPFMGWFIYGFVVLWALGALAGAAVRYYRKLT